MYLYDVATSPDEFNNSEFSLTNEGPLVAIDWIGILLKRIITNHGNKTNQDRCL